VSSMLQVQVKLFGAFRSITSQLELSLDQKLSYSEFRSHLRSYLASEFKMINSDLNTDTLSALLALLERSALADESQILNEDIWEKLWDRTAIRLAILPPVCGG
jgi:molybdopterin converting factor small subunit